MSAELHATFVSTGTAPKRFALGSCANTALKVTATLWFVVAVIGQLLFAFTTAAFYSLTAARGDFAAWGHRYTPGETSNNLVMRMHLLAAVIIIVAGAIQFVPQIRNRFPVFHRWVGRFYVFIALAVSASGVYLVWVRGTVGDAAQHWGVTFNAALIWLCALMAARYAIARNFKTHRRWALRLFLVVGGVWFFRVGLFLSFLIFKRPFGFDPSTLIGPFITFLTYAQFLLPLAVAELFFRTQDRPGALRRIAMAFALLVMTVATGAGVAVVTAAVWVPHIKAAFDGRKSIAAVFSGTLESRGIDAAERQYHELKAAGSAAYNFDEKQLDALGYQFLRAKKVSVAIRIFQLNVEAYPKSSNTWDSLAEGYLDSGNTSQAIAHYRKAVELNAKNRNAAAALQRLTSPARGTEK